MIDFIWALFELVKWNYHHPTCVYRQLARFIKAVIGLILINQNEHSSCYNSDLSLDVILNLSK